MEQGAKAAAAAIAPIARAGPAATAAALRREAKGGEALRVVGLEAGEELLLNGEELVEGVAVVVAEGAQECVDLDVALRLHELAHALGRPVLDHRAERPLAAALELRPERLEVALQARLCAGALGELAAVGVERVAAVLRGSGEIGPLPLQLDDAPPDGGRHGRCWGRGGSAGAATAALSRIPSQGHVVLLLWLLLLLSPLLRKRRLGRLPKRSPRRLIIICCRLVATPSVVAVIGVVGTLRALDGHGPANRSEERLCALLVEPVAARRRLARVQERRVARGAQPCHEG